MSDPEVYRFDPETGQWVVNCRGGEDECPSACDCGCQSGRYECNCAPVVSS